MILFQLAINAVFSIHIQIAHNLLNATIIRIIPILNTPQAPASPNPDKHTRYEDKYYSLSQS